ncbi:GNAT family N-acetyltransferase [Microbulbifer sp. OS29]|uniref:GNAT family N-acetyltransferase n=1 Tax=Microbulbifer okhotskensis TaxID=2926617 RepID=A0A9X2EI81_9GAMM|nr:GNAT family protein [Microbulbifer okhotskensis]MCO1332707.1 GNAT family N-acetyltransferase [Microbulbifer okhotskensis]
MRILEITVDNEIQLDPLMERDAEQIFELIESNRPLLERYLYWAKTVVDLSSTQEYINERVYSNHFGSAWYKIIFNREVAGIFGIKTIDQEKNSAEVGYWLCKERQGRGVMTRVLGKIGVYLKDQKNITALKIHCLSENTASIAVAERVGGVHSDTIPNYYLINGTFQDLKIYTVII